VGPRIGDNPVTARLTSLPTVGPNTGVAGDSTDDDPLADPRHIHLTYTHSHPCYADQPAARTWHIRADLQYGDLRLADEDPAGHVGDIRLLTVRPGAHVGPLTSLDAGNSHRISQAVLDPRTGGLNCNLTDHIGRRRGRHGTLILDQAQLTRQWRGYGLGVLLVGTAIRTLSAGCRIAACYPEPVLEPDVHRDPIDIQIAHATLGEVFAQLGRPR
jgi:hypothetical protein